MRQTSLSRALNRFKPIGADVWEYRADLEALAATCAGTQAHRVHHPASS